MKRIVFTLFLLANAALGFAQQKNTSNYEIGGGINIYGIPGTCGGPSREFGPGFYAEYRYGVTNHFAVGGQVNHKFGNGESEFIGDGYPVKELKYNQTALKAIADYNICPSRLVNPFFGVGLGAGMLNEKRSDNTSDNYLYGTICPRIGVQIWHFRLSIGTDFAFFDSIATATYLNLGFTF